MIAFAQPLAFLLLGLLPIIVLLYLLKLRRTEQLISSIYLWQRMVRDLEANAPWQRLHPNILMILQLLFIIVLMLALARPTLQSSRQSSQALILVIDSSASMAASDVSPTRLEAAKAQARRLITETPETTTVTIIEAGHEARTLVTYSTDRRLLLQTLEAIEPQPFSPDMGVALQLASAIAARQPESRIILLSDGNFEIPPRLGLQKPLTFTPIGLQNENQAISLFTLQPEPSGGLTAFLRLTNYGTLPAQRRLNLFADGHLVDTYDVEIPAEGEQTVLAQGLPADTRVVSAKLGAPTKGKDFLTWDDQAQVVFQPSGSFSVTLVTRGNLFLETALALLPSLEVTLLNEAESAPLPPADLTILDGQIPLNNPFPEGNLLFIAPPQSTPFFEVSGVLTSPAPHKPDPAHSLLQFVNIDTINILDSYAIPLPVWARAVIDTQVQSGERFPLLFIGETAGRRIAVFAFDLRHSDLPLQVAFPVLFANLMETLLPGFGGAIPPSVSPGTILHLPLIALFPSGSEENTDSVRLTRPDGTQAVLQAENGQLTIAETGQLGVYQLQVGSNPPRYYAVNLFSPQESRLNPIQDLDTFLVEGFTLSASTPPERREIWRPFALLALSVLLMEWLIYHRPTLRLILSRLRTGMARH